MPRSTGLARAVEARCRFARTSCGQHAVHARERKALRRENGGDPREHFERRPDAVLGAARAGVPGGAPPSTRNVAS